MKQSLFYIFFITSLILTVDLAGQELDIPSEEKSTIYIDGISPFVLSHAEVEASITSSLTSFWNVFNGYNRNGEFYSNIYRLSVANSIANISYGFSNDGRWDLGAEFHYTFRRFDDRALNSPFKVFSGESPSFNGLSYLGLRARLMPFEKLPNLTVIGSALFPNGDKVLRRNLGADRTQMNLYATYFERINTETGYFFQGGWGFHFAGSSNSSMINAINAGAYLSINLWSNQLFVIPGLAYAGTYYSDMTSLSQGVFGIAVLQYQAGTKVSINLQQGLPLLFESNQPSVAFERTSFSTTSLGLRMLFQ